MSESDVPQVIVKSARSIAAEKRWAKIKMENQLIKQEQKMEKKKFDWSLPITIISIVVPIVGSIFGCYVSLASSLKDVCVRIETVRTELSSDISAVRLDLSKEISNVRQDLSREIANVRQEISSVRLDVSGEIAKTNLEIAKIQTVLISKELVKKDEFIRSKEEFSL